MSGVNKRLTFAGVSKQTAKGAAAAAATYGFGLLSGSWDPGINQESDEITSDNRLSAQANRIESKPTMQCATRAYDELIGLLLYGALGAIVTSGVGPYTHVITHADDLPYLTFFGRNDSLYSKFADSKVSRLKLASAGPGLVTVECDLLSAGYEILAAAFTITNNEASRPRFRSSAGTFKMDASTNVPVTAPISAWEIEFVNNVEQNMLSKQITPDDVTPGGLQATWAVTLLPDDLTEWREAVTGTGAGTAVEDDAVYGSGEITLVIDANTDLKFESDKVGFLGTLPEADPAGGKAEVQLVGNAYKPSAGDSIKATLRNAVVSY